VEPCRGWLLAQGRREVSNSNDLDIARQRAVSPSHFSVHLRDSPTTSDVTILLVHVVSRRSAVITEPDGIVLDTPTTPLGNLLTRKYLPSRFLGLVETLHEEPETGLGQYLIPSEDPHAEDLLLWRLLRRSRTANDVVFINSHLEGRVFPGLHHVAVVVVVVAAAAVVRPSQTV